MKNVKIEHFLIQNVCINQNQLYELIRIIYILIVEFLVEQMYNFLELILLIIVLYSILRLFNTSERRDLLAGKYPNNNGQTVDLNSVGIPDQLNFDNEFKSVFSESNNRSKLDNFTDLRVLGVSGTTGLAI